LVHLCRVRDGEASFVGHHQVLSRTIRHRVANAACLARPGVPNMSEPRYCPQFQTRMEQIPLKRRTTMLPIRRCLLAERMVEKLRDRPDAVSFVAAIAVDPLAQPPLCIHGPDLDTIEYTKCTSERCATSCSPSYRDILARCGAEDRHEIACEVQDSNNAAPPAEAEPIEK
jgi:hypothetical protein